MVLRKAKFIFRCLPLISMLYRSLLRPALFHLPPETAHELTLHTVARVLRSERARAFVARRLAPRENTSAFGAIERFGLRFKNPLGLAAGFDKNGEAAAALAAFGFGFIEVGTVTRHAQEGNARPRIFRLPEDEAIINRAGFNNQGAHVLVENLKSQKLRGVPLGINIGKSRIVEIENATQDYLASFEIVYDAADYVAVNVSSPNTPNLRELQRANALDELLSALQTRNRELAAQKRRAPLPLLVKIAPDVSPHEIETFVDVARRNRLAGIIATNTTTSRADLKTAKTVIESYGAGGLSGRPLRARSTQVIAATFRAVEQARAQNQLKIIGVGGIFTAEDAWEKICAGASLVQIYTGLIYKGIVAVRHINEGLVRIMRREGFKNLDEAVGCRVEQFAAA
jgi:dihydroorotate dehydrogenase